MWYDSVMTEMLRGVCDHAPFVVAAELPIVASAEGFAVHVQTKRGRVRGRTRGGLMRIDAYLLQLSCI